MFSKKKKKGKGSSRKSSAKLQAFSKRKRFSGKNSQILRQISGQEKKLMPFSPFLTTQKVVLFSSEDTVFSRTCRLPGQGLDLEGQGLGLQNVFSRPRTSSRTPLQLPVTLGGSFILYLFMPSIKQVSCEYSLLLPLV